MANGFSGLLPLSNFSKNYRKFLLFLKVRVFKRLGRYLVVAALLDRCSHAAAFVTWFGAWQVGPWYPTPHTMAHAIGDTFVRHPVAKKLISKSGIADAMNL